MDWILANFLSGTTVHWEFQGSRPFYLDLHKISVDKDGFPLIFGGPYDLMLIKS